MEINFNWWSGLPKEFCYSGIEWDSLTKYEYKRYIIVSWINKNIAGKYRILKFNFINRKVKIDVDNCYIFVNGRGLKQKEHIYFENMFGDRVCSNCYYAPDGHRSIEECMFQVRKYCTCGHDFFSHTLENNLGCIECDCEQIVGLEKI